jgi:hypothetical protein
MSCKIPRLDPFSPGAVKILSSDEEGLPYCWESKAKFETDLDSHLIRMPGHEDYWKNVTCCYETFTRGMDDMEVSW